MEKSEMQRSLEYQTLLDNIPGGVQKCLPDEFFTMVEINQGFITMFGYSKEELSERFQNRFISLIHPDDLQRVVAEVQAQLKEGEPITMSYRVLCKDGTYKWVMDYAQRIYEEQGNERIFCVLMDETESREAREELRLTMERHEIILDQATDIIFEWDLRDDTMIYSGNWEKKFGYAPQYKGIDQPDTAFQHIHPDDMETFSAALWAARNGQPFTETEARIQNATGRYIWCRFRATVQYDENGSPLKAVGIITDIDEERRMIDDLRRRAERDALTGLYNREETERQICRYLEGKPQRMCALFMIDTDDFKQINDSQGHIFGDAVLSELAAGMKRMTRQTDVVGRIGGDEFAIFMKDIPSRDVAIQKAEALTQMFRDLFHDDRHVLRVSCSVGVALYPENGEDFPSLYRNADRMLYQAKSLGKNRYMMAEPGNATPVNVTGYSSLGAAIDSDMRGQEVPDSLVNYVFQVLYDTKDIDNSVQLILEIVGKRFDVSRAYIFENDESDMYTSNTFEWCNDGIVPEKGNLQNLPHDIIEVFRRQFKDGSIFYCRDIYSLPPEMVELLAPQGVRSILHCAIMHNDNFCGIVGFDECTGMRMWTKEEIGILSLVSQLITTFLLKKRASERDQQLTLRLNTILESQDAYIYAIERGTYRLLYLNHKTRELDASAEKGMCCYNAFFGRRTPCENCPLSDGSGEMYNPRYGVWTKVRVSPMRWGALDAYLLSCYDITEYKQIQS